MIWNISTYPFFSFLQNDQTIKTKRPYSLRLRRQIEKPKSWHWRKQDFFSRSRTFFRIMFSSIFYLATSIPIQNKIFLKFTIDNTRTPSDYFIANSVAFDASYKDIIVVDPTIPWWSLKNSFCLVSNVHLDTQLSECKSDLSYPILQE